MSDLLQHIALNTVPEGIPFCAQLEEGGKRYWNALNRGEKYSLNSHGYRGAEFELAGDLSVMSIGCSVCFGEAIAEEETIGALLADRLRSELSCTVDHFNLGVPGASNDAIARRLHLALPVLNPDFVIVFFTAPGRREYGSHSNRLLPLLPSMGELRAGEHEHARIHYLELLSEPDSVLNLFRNYKGIEGALHDRPWLCVFWDTQSIQYLGGHLDPAHYAGNMLWPFLDLGTDGGHPGPQTNLELADRVWRKMLSDRIVEELRKQQSARRTHPNRDVLGRSVLPQNMG